VGHGGGGDLGGQVLRAAEPEADAPPIVVTESTRASSRFWADPAAA
jgi:hypothetical protein